MKKEKEEKSVATPAKTKRTHYDETRCIRGHTKNPIEQKKMAINRQKAERS